MFAFLQNPVVVYGSKDNERAGVSGILVPHSRRLQLRLLDLFGTSMDSAVTITAGGLFAFNETASSTPTPIGPASLGDFKLDSSKGVFELDLGVKAGALPRGRYVLEVTAVKKAASTGLLAGVSKAKVSLNSDFSGLINCFFFHCFSFVDSSASRVSG